MKKKKIICPFYKDTRSETTKFFDKIKYILFLVLLFSANYLHFFLLFVIASDIPLSRTKTGEIIMLIYNYFN